MGYLPADGKWEHEKNPKNPNFYMVTGALLLAGSGSVIADRIREMIEENSDKQDLWAYLVVAGILGFFGVWFLSQSATLFPGNNEGNSHPGRIIFRVAMGFSVAC